MNPDHVAELVRLRMNQAREALVAGRTLLDDGLSVQGSVNRSYYAMFYAALALLQTIGKTPRKHTGVVSLFDTEFVLKGLLPKELSKDFHRIFDLRHASDYDPVRSPSHEVAAAALARAMAFVGEVEQFLKEP